MRSVRFSALLRRVLPSLLVLTAGCASDKEHVEKQLSKLNEEIRHLQSETDRMTERLDGVESRQAMAPRVAEERVAINAATVSRPKLKVVRVEPGDDSGAGDVPEANPSAPEDDASPRVVIQGEGKSVESRTVTGTAAPSAKTSRPEASKARKSEPSAPKSDAAASK
jgi:hypothetical protein